jgi:hypothetical protein
VSTRFLGGGVTGVHSPGPRCWLQVRIAPRACSRSYRKLQAGRPKAPLGPPSLTPGNLCADIRRDTIGWMELFEVERKVDGHWYSIGAPVEADSASKGVAMCAVSEGTYRVRPAEPAKAAPEYFEVPAWGQPVRVRHS